MENKFTVWLDNKKNNIYENSLIDTSDLVSFLDNVKSIIFPGYLEYLNDISEFFENKVNNIKQLLTKLITNVEQIEKCKLEKNKIITDFLNCIPEIDDLLKTDIDALFEGDPAAKSKTEIILCYPGLQAIVVHRIAHALHLLGIPILPRALSEYAHSKTGIDIHPASTIGKYFFIDHGTGIVIGETCVIGEHVKIYQGVTLGALSLREGQKLKGTKRHPTIMDNVTIYSGASIFGGETIIGENTTIGSSAFITSSVESNMIVTIQGQKKKHLK